MKIKFESNKTYLRLSKPEFQTLRQNNHLQEDFLFPGGQQLKIIVELEPIQYFSFEGDEMRFGLPFHVIQIYKPNKVGLSLIFQHGNDQKHTVVFEVDIKKPQLSPSPQIE